MNMRGKQKGASVIGLIIGLAILSYGVYVGYQYIPQYIEFGTVESILNNIGAKHKVNRVQSAREIMNSISRQLNINQMNDMKDNFYVRQNGETYVIEVSYERKLDLLYKTKLMIYKKTITLK